jgi:FkbM family methyltransferase
MHREEDRMPGQFLGEVYRTEQGIFCVDPRDHWISASIKFDGEYGTDELKNLKALVPREASVLLIGAHIGTLAIPLSKWVANLAAIEANPDTFRLLEINLMLNQCGNVAAFNYAANNTTGTLDFVMNTENSGGSKRKPIFHDPSFFSDNPKIVQVKAVALDEVFPNAIFHLIFMDIEGSEVFAMRGMSNLLSHASVVVAEFIPNHLSKVANIGVDEFLAPLAAFDTLLIPSKRLKVSNDQFAAVLREMVDLDESDPGIIFLRKSSGIEASF